MLRRTAAGQLDPFSSCFFKAMLTDDAQCVVGDHRQMQHQAVAGKMPAWQPFDIHVGFQFAVILLAGAVIMVQVDHFRRGHFHQRAPVGFHFDFRKHQLLSLFIDGALDHLENDRIRQRLPVYSDSGLADPDALSLASRNGLAAAQGHIKPSRWRLPAQVALRRLRLMMKSTLSRCTSGKLS